MIVFTMLFPYVNNPNKVKTVGLVGVILSGMTMALTMAINISVLSVNLTSRYPFPLLSVIQSIQVAQFLERLDVFFMIALVIGSFFKIAIFFYGAVIGTASLFKVKEPSQLCYPLGFVVLFLSITIARSFQETVHEGRNIIPFSIHLPFQVIIPVLLLIIAFFKNYKKQRQ